MFAARFVEIVYVAYTGRYRVDGDKWITTVDVSANPA